MLGNVVVDIVTTDAVIFAVGVNLIEHSQVLLTINALVEEHEALHAVLRRNGGHAMHRLELTQGIVDGDMAILGGVSRTLLGLAREVDLVHVHDALAGFSHQLHLRLRLLIFLPLLPVEPILRLFISVHHLLGDPSRLKALLSYLVVRLVRSKSRLSISTLSFNFK